MFFICVSAVFEMLTTALTMFFTLVSAVFEMLTTALTMFFILVSAVIKTGVTLLFLQRLNRIHPRNPVAAEHHHDRHNEQHGHRANDEIERREGDALGKLLQPLMGDEEGADAGQNGHHQREFQHVPSEDAKHVLHRRAVDFADGHLLAAAVRFVADETDKA